jgi:hypothetical protein
VVGVVDLSSICIIKGAKLCRREMNIFGFVDTMNVFGKLRRKVYQSPVEIYTKSLIPALHTVQKWTYLSGKSILGPNRIK